MLKENFKLVFRKLLRQKMYVIINVVGLAIALVAAMLIYSHIAKEWSTDCFHKNGNAIYRVIDKHQSEQNWNSWTSVPVGPYMKAEYPEITNFVRINGPREYRLKLPAQEDFSGTIQCVFSDAQFFDMFTFPLVAGKQPSGTEPDWVIISETLARRYFPDKYPVGELLTLKEPQDEGDRGVSYRVIGVMKNIPSASTIQADAVVDFSSKGKENEKNWGMHGVYTYFQLSDEADISRLERAIPALIEKNYQWIVASEHTMKLQSLKDIYFNSEDVQEYLPHGSKRLNIILCGITLLILILACCNYWMIKIASLSRNTIGLAVQRCFGASSSQLKRQLLWETGMLVGIALILAIGMTYILHPYFVRIISPRWPYPLDFSFGEMMIFLLLLLLFVWLVTRMSSWYILRRLDQDGIKQTIHNQRVDVKKILSIVQMCIFSALLCCSVVLIRQMNFVKNRSLGFNNERVVMLSWRDRNLNMMTFRSELMSHPDIMAISNGQALPLLDQDPRPLIPEDTPDQSIGAYMIHGDAEYLETYQIHLNAGRGIDSKSYPSHLDDFLRYRPGRIPEVLVNRKFVEKWGTKDPIGKIIYENGNKEIGMKVVGVVDDFHFLTLYQAIQPAYIIYEVPFISYSILIRYREGKRTEVLSWLEKCYKEKFNNSEFFYQEYNYSELYDKDIAVVQLINVFTVIAILISGMGIFAFSVFMAESRNKEVALRKVNGARVGEIVSLLNLDMIKKVALACLIGLPIAYYIMSIWLEGFAYRIGLEAWIFLLVILVSVTLVLLITTWHTWRTALRNPVEAIKSL